MTLFAGALLRTIEFVMVTTDASFPGPGERGGGGGSGRREPGRRAEDARRGEGRRRRGTGPPRCRNPRGAAGPQGRGGQAGGQAMLDGSAGVANAQRSRGPRGRVGMEVHEFFACLLNCPGLLGVLAASSALCLARAGASGLAE